MLTSTSQTSVTQELKITSDINTLRQDILTDASLEMIELRKSIPTIEYDLKYATSDNFTHVRLYPEGLHFTFMRKEAVEALVKINHELAKKGISIKVWDAYRPYAVTQKFWDIIHDERYVANPSKGSGHNRGIAIDLTLIDVNTGKELDMPTEFDDFSERAHHGYMNLSPEKIKNREFLREIMEKNGFIKFDTEWWHYYLPNGDKYNVLDIPFEKLK